MNKRVTMEMIAEACQTSIGTVDRALNNRADINPETKKNILETAWRLGYKTNKLAGALSRKKPLRMAFIYPSLPDGFYQNITAGIGKAANELEPYGVEFDTLHFDARDPQTELELLESFRAEDYDAVAINPQDVGCADYIRRFVRAGVPTATFNNDLPDSGRLFYVGEDAELSGRMGADVLGTLLNGEGGVTVMGNFVHAKPFFERFEGFCSVVQKHYPGITVYSCADCRLDEELTMQNIQNLLEQTRTIRGIFCAGYFSTIGTIEALRRLHRQDIMLVGYDVSPTTARAVRDGLCRVLLYQDPYQQGYQTASLLARHLLEGWRPVSGRLLIETRLVFRQNIGNYESGMTLWDQAVL